MLPSIPRKSKQLCHDVQPALRDIFQNTYPTLPLMAFKSAIRQSASEENISKTELDVLRTRERQLTTQRRTNSYKLAELNSSILRAVDDRRTSKLLTSEDLLPPVELKLCADTTLWVKNILAATRHQDSESKDSLYPMRGLQSRMSTLPEAASQSVSMVRIGSCTLTGRRRSVFPPPARAAAGPAPPHLLRAVPPQIDFVNCRVGQKYTHQRVLAVLAAPPALIPPFSVMKTIRLVNVSKIATLFTIVPPRRTELAVRLVCVDAGAGARYAGGATVVRVHFTPLDVRALRDQLRVHVRGGATEVVPIQCYMEAPVLNISLLDEGIEELSHAHSPGDTEAVVGPSDSKRSHARVETESSDTLDLGAMLLGGMRRVDMALQCSSRHVAFFILTEEAWLDWNVDNITRSGALLADPFVVRPTYFSGGGVIPGTIWCTPDSPGLHVRTLRVLASTAVVRELYLLVDAVHFQFELIHILAEEKNFDICADEDTRCQSYLNLGTAFPGRKLSKTFEFVNDSPVAYAYYWVVRTWGVCLCAPGSNWGVDEGQSSDIVVQPSNGRLAAQSTCCATVTLQNAAHSCGTGRVILMLILRNIPRESFPSGYDPIIISRRTIVAECAPGMQDYSYEECDLVCGSVEVWWQVEPVRVMIQPCKLRLPHTYWSTEVQVDCTVTQLTSADEITCEWQTPSDAALIVPKGAFVASVSHSAQIQVPLEPRPPSSAVIQVVAGEGDFTTSMVVERLPIRRMAELSPTQIWCNIQPPLEFYQTKLTVLNEKDEQVTCAVSTHREGWLCCVCSERRCACAIVTPLNSSVEPQRVHDIVYMDTTHKKRGAVLTLLQLVDKDNGALPGQCSLVAVYSQPPRVALQLLTGLDHTESKLEDICELEAGCSYVARPSCALTLGLSTQFEARLSNYSPIEANFTWELPLDEGDPLDMSFCPNEGVIPGYGHIDIQVTVCGKRVCARRVSVRSCRVSARGSAPPADTVTVPVYLLVDTAVTGASVSLHIPTGVDGSKIVRVLRILDSDLKNDGASVSLDIPTGIEISKIVRLLRSFESYLKNDGASVSLDIPTGVEGSKIVPVFRNLESYLKNDGVSVILDNRTEIGTSKIVSVLRSFESYLKNDEKNVSKQFDSEAATGEHREASMIDESVADNFADPAAASEVPCIQFVSIPLRTVCERTVRLQNESLLPTHWSVLPTLFPRQRRPLNVVVKDKWKESCTEHGVCVQCSPSGGRLEARGAVDVHVRVYADTWGVYCESLLFEVTEVESAERTTVALSVWVEAVGSPLQILLKSEANENIPSIWFTQFAGEEERRTLRVRNVSRAPLHLRTYVLSNHYNGMDASSPAGPRPFRVLINFHDTIPCGCSSQISKQEPEESNSNLSTYSEVVSSTIEEVVGTGIELYLAPDYGQYHEENYKIRPTTLELSCGEVATLEVARERSRRRRRPAAQPLECPGRTSLDDLGKAKCSAPAESAYSRLVARTSSYSLRDSIKAQHTLQAQQPLHNPAQAELSLQNSAQKDQNSAQVYSVRNSKQAEYLLRDSKQTVYSLKNATEGQYSHSRQQYSIDNTSEVRISEQQFPSTQSLVINSIQEECPIQWPEEADRTARALAVNLLIEMLPTITRGIGWERGSAGTMALHIRDNPRSGELYVTPERLTVRLCAATLPLETAVRVRKKVRIQNSGSGAMDVTARCDPPWTLVTAAPAPPVPSQRAALTRSLIARLHLPPGAAVEVRAELCACAADVVPLKSPQPPVLLLHNSIVFLQGETVLKSVNLELEVEYPRLVVEPDELNLGVCSVGDSWKEYFTVTHTGRNTSLDVIAVWSGDDTAHEIRLHPSRLRLAQAERGIFYVQYAPRSATARKGEVRLWVANAAWCAASVRVRAQSSRDNKYREPAHCRDYTDDIVLQPAPIAHWRDYADDEVLQPPPPPSYRTDETATDDDDHSPPPPPSSLSHSTAEIVAEDDVVLQPPPEPCLDYADDVVLQPPPPELCLDYADDIVLQPLVQPKRPLRKSS